MANINLRPIAAGIAAVALVLSLSWSAGPVMAALPTSPIVTSPATGTSTSSSPVRIYGTAELGTEVFVSGGATPASGITDASGNWSALVNLTAESDNVLAFIAKDAMGSSSVAAYITITHSSSAGGTTTAPTGDVTAPNAPIITAPTSPHATSTSPIRFTGTAEAGATIVVTGGWITSTTTASALGAWSTFLNLFADTSHDISVVAIDAAGNVSATTTFSITHTSSTTPPASTTTPPAATTTPTTSTSTPPTSTTTVTVTTSTESGSGRSGGGSSGDFRYPVGAQVFTNPIPNMSPIWLESSVLFPQIMVLGVSTNPSVSLLFTNDLRLGSRGPEVTALQIRLRDAGYFRGPVTGYYGVMTRAAVRTFQKAAGVSATGNVGPLTRAVLNS